MKKKVILWQDGGILFAIIPISVMIETSLKCWRKELLNNNTLLSVVTFPQDLFNPSASVGTVGVFIKKGIPHNFNSQKVFFARMIYDGYKIKKGKRIRNAKVRDMILEFKDELKAFIVNQNLNFKDIPEVKKICLLDRNDKNIELVPENYIDGKIPTFEEIHKGIEDLIKSCACYIIKNK